MLVPGSYLDVIVLGAGLSSRPRAPLIPGAEADVTRPLCLFLLTGSWICAGP